ncbi:MAG: hypothetical protein VX523_04945 [Chloroflexota bacterium]|nr:hypothetical protein [Chloroflexota bacterium]
MNDLENLNYGKFQDSKKIIDISLNFIISNKYEYGPDFENKDKQYTVSKIETDNDISRIYFSYKIQGFSNSGEEYIEIDSENNVLTRRVTKFPKLNKPKFLIALTIFSVLFAAVLIPWLFLNSDELDPLYKSGKVLWIKSGEPTYDLKINYDGPDVDTGKLTNWEIDSTDKGSYLGFIKLQIINETANTITLNIDTNAAELLASNGKTYFPTNSVSRAYEINKLDNNYKVNDFIPLWGDITLVEGTQVIGYLLVDLPKDVTVSRLRWIASDTVTINY